MKPKRRQAQIRQRRSRRRKNVSFRDVSVQDLKRIREQKKGLVPSKFCWDRRSLSSVADSHGLTRLGGWGRSIPVMVRRLRRLFPTQIIHVLNEGSGRSSFKKDLLRKFSGGEIKVTTTDIRPNVADHTVNVHDLVKQFGKNRFHLLVSTYGGAFYSSAPEHALFQIMSVLKPRGVSVLHISIKGVRMKELGKRFGFAFQKIPLAPDSYVLTKNDSNLKTKRVVG